MIVSAGERGKAECEYDAGKGEKKSATTTVVKCGEEMRIGEDVAIKKKCGEESKRRMGCIKGSKVVNQSGERG
jgi:hypothetical protein